METKELEIKLEKLEEVKRKLKNDFIGLDDQIDKIIDNLKIWYCMPDILARPVIINLWGMTGTGKTDLVRKLTRYLGFTDKLLEVQMDTAVAGANGIPVDNLRNALLSSDIEENEPGIVLLDEFQRFKTHNGKGEDIEAKFFNDTWMLLSDGVFTVGSTTIKSDFETLIEDKTDDIEAAKKWKARHKNKKKGEELDDDFMENYHSRVLTEKLSRWEAKSIKSKLRLKESINELREYTTPELIKKIKGEYSKISGDVAYNYKKTLVFVCGNLDTAYRMAGAVSDADSDADILHEFSKRINIISIKNSLASYFKPEQIARLGNIHVIYPCLNKNNYKKIIKKTARLFVNDVKKQTGIRIKYGANLINTFYNNFVYPTQGVRPVFSGVNGFFSTVIPNLLFESKTKFKNADVELVVENGVLQGKIKNKTFPVTYEFDLDNLKSNMSESNLTLFAVHEAGHALLYSMIYKYVPKYIHIEMVNGDMAYVMPYEHIYNVSDKFNEAIIKLGGAVAEELIFGKENRSMGSTSDIRSASTDAANLVREHSADEYVGWFLPEFEDSAKLANTDFAKTNTRVEFILNDALDKARNMIGDNINLLLKIVDVLLKKRKIGGKELHSVLCKDIKGLKFMSDLDLLLKPEKIIYDYAGKYTSFLNDRK